jgi:hypothetical protein
MATTLVQRYLAAPEDASAPTPAPAADADDDALADAFDRWAEAEGFSVIEASGVIVLSRKS